MDVEANDILVAPVGEQATVNFVRAVNGFFRCGAFGRGAMRVAFERDAHFKFAPGLLQRAENQNGEKCESCGNNNPPGLILLGHSFLNPKACTLTG